MSDLLGQQLRTFARIEEEFFPREVTVTDELDDKPSEPFVSIPLARAQELREAETQRNDLLKERNELRAAMRAAIVELSGTDPNVADAYLTLSLTLSLTFPSPRSRKVADLREALLVWFEATRYAADQPISSEHRAKQNAVEQALAAEPRESLDPVTLANVIREVDGNHDLGAGELAERILSHPRLSQALRSEQDK